MSRRPTYLLIAAAISALPLIWFVLDPDAGDALLSMSRQTRATTSLAKPMTTTPAVATLKISEQEKTITPHATNPPLGVTSAAAIVPAIELPLAATITELKRLLANGDGYAGCQLVIQLRYCRGELGAQREQLRDLRNRQIDVAESTAQREFADSFIERLARMTKIGEAHCAGVPPEELANSPQYALLAAQTGNVAAMSQYVRSPPMDSANFLRDLDAWQQYRDLAPGFAERAANGGDINAISFMSRQLAGRWRGVGGAIVPRDLKRAVMLHFVLEKTDSPYGLGKDEMRNIAPEIGPVGIAEARQAADIYYQKIFGASTGDGKKPSYRDQQSCDGIPLQLKLMGL